MAPTVAHALDFRYFRNADIITGVTANPTKPFDYAAELLQAATMKRSLVTTTIPRFARLAYDQSNAGALDSELVIEASWLDTLSADPEIVSLWRARAEGDGVWCTMGRCR